MAYLYRCIKFVVVALRLQIPPPTPTPQKNTTPSCTVKQKPQLYSKSLTDSWHCACVCVHVLGEGWIVELNWGSEKNKQNPEIFKEKKETHKQDDKDKMKKGEVRKTFERLRKKEEEIKEQGRRGRKKEKIWKRRWRKCTNAEHKQQRWSPCTREAEMLKVTLMMMLPSS